MTLPQKVRYATRRSALALAQCRAFIGELTLARPGLAAIELQVVTSGDRIQDRPLSEVGGKGLFVKEIEEALLADRADVAVHSIKDVPGVMPDGLSIVCIPKRVDPRDVLIAPRFGSLMALPMGTKVGTSSLRRALSLKARRPDLNIVPLRGNVDTRLKKVEGGEYDAIVLAAAGLSRLGLLQLGPAQLEPGKHAQSALDVDVSLPAVGQGALGIEARAGDDAIAELLLPLHDPETAVCVLSDRGVMEALEGECKSPLASYALRCGGARLRGGFAAGTDGCPSPLDVSARDGAPGASARDFGDDSRLTGLPSSTGGMRTETSSPSGRGSLSSSIGTTTAATSASTIAPISRRRPRRLNSSRLGSAASAIVVRVAPAGSSPPARRRAPQRP